MTIPKKGSEAALPSSGWVSDPWMHQLFDAVLTDAEEPDYGPGAWFRWLADGAPASSRPRWLQPHVNNKPSES